MKRYYTLETAKTEHPDKDVYRNCDDWQVEYVVLAGAELPPPELELVWKAKSEQKPTVDYKELPKQIQGSHYANDNDVFKFSLDNGHDCLQHAAIKYIHRHKEKNGKEDILKAMSVLNRILKEQYDDNTLC